MNNVEEAKMIRDGDKAFQDFDKGVNEAMKQNQVVEDEIKKNIAEQKEHEVQEA
jgi:hypothetical protein